MIDKSGNYPMVLITGIDICSSYCFSHFILITITIITIPCFGDHTGYGKRIMTIAKAAKNRNSWGQLWPVMQWHHYPPRANDDWWISAMPEFIINHCMYYIKYTNAWVWLSNSCTNGEWWILFSLMIASFAATRLTISAGWRWWRASPGREPAACSPSNF